MKLIPSLTLIWTFFSTAGALQCQTCTDVQCLKTEPVTCSSDKMCITASILATSAGTTRNQIYKACASSSLCAAAVNQTFSASSGVAGAVASVQCCNTDNCNSETVASAVPAAQSDNDLRCFSCDSFTSECTTSLVCKGVEDLCFTAHVMRESRRFIVFGCASANLCAAASSLSTLPFLQSFGNISGPNCCGYSLCNTVKRIHKRDSNSNAATPTTGSVTPTTGSVTPTTGNVTPTTGNVTPTTRNVTPTTGNVTSIPSAKSTINDTCFIQKCVILLLPALTFTLY